MIIGFYKMIRGSFCRRIGIAGLIRGYFGEFSGGTERPKNFIGTKLVEKYIIPLSPVCSRCLKQGECPAYVCLYKSIWIKYRIINMCFSSKMDDCINFILFE